MKYTLKEYQADAVGAVLNRLGRARESLQGSYPSPSSFSLTATTGAGKTVMAAAVLEALFDGNDDECFEADPTAVVLWFTDDPSLNEQTRARLIEASDLAPTRLRVIEPTFADDRLRPGNVYFLNAQKLSKNALLVRGAPADDLETLDFAAPPDLRATTFWEVLRNTIEDPHSTLYLVLDEAHRGMRRRTATDDSERRTIVRRLIDGVSTGSTGNSPPVPIVWGISATVQRFEDAMRETGDGRTHLPPVQVSTARVRESGLLKDDVRLDFPDETGQFDTVLLARAARRTREATQLWREYAASQDPAPEPVLPLLVVQMPNTPDDELLAAAFRTVRDTWPDLADDAMAHVFGDHRTIELGGFTVPHVAPEKVHESTWIRVLFAKDAVSTGWDCPRAEVLMSFRPAKDRTHITQMLGRMVRNPLARRVPGDDRLNAVECLLPRFDRRTAISVAEALLGGDGDVITDPPPPLIDPVELRPNAAVGDAVWAAFDALPSQTLPRRGGRPIKQLLALAQALSRDGLQPGARRAAVDRMCDVLVGQAAEHEVAVEAAATDVRTLSGQTIITAVGGAAEVLVTESFTEDTDDRAVAADYVRAGRVFTRDLAGAYVDRLAGDGGDDALLDAEVRVAALARVEGVGEELDRKAHALAESWLSTHRVAIKDLSDERQAAYDDIRAMAREPMRIDVLRPRVRLESTRDAEGELLPTLAGHLMSDRDGNCPVATLNEWETAVVEKEMARNDARAWYRNPSRPSPDAHAVAYRDGSKEWRRLCPDFVFFHGADDVRVSIVDPHGHHLGDALPKLRGLADYAGDLGRDLYRVEAITKIDGTLRVLDLTSADVRAAVAIATSAEALYRDLGDAYL